MKKILDLIPLFILSILAVALLVQARTNGTGFFGRHIAGFIVLPISYLAFLWRHKIGVLTLGVILLMGLFNLLSYSHTIKTYTFFVGSRRIPLFYGQPMFLLWLLIHFIVSGRHYKGIFSKAYWHNINRDNNKTVTSRWISLQLTQNLKLRTF